MLKTPPLQTATATIDTLCGRLQSATLLEDRRAAILGLRSFAKQYPASVASGSLRELITTLRRDGLGQQTGEGDAGKKKEDGTCDVDTIRLILETLLMLFNPDAGSPEAGDEIAFFMADEFSMRQDNVTLLLNLLDPTSPYADYYARLYSLQILSATCAARPDRLQECILAAPLGVSRLVGMLDDTRDAVRNAALLLLVDLTSGANEELRKIVAFEDVFAKAFALIRMEGGLAEAGITAQDCLSLLANLIAGSGSNQTMFRESGCVTQLAQLLQQVFPAQQSEPAFMAQSREKSAFGLLQLLRLFLLAGENNTPQNQVAFFRVGTAQTLIDIGFSNDLPLPIRAASLRCTSELIATNHPLQESFAALTVASTSAADNISRTPTPQINGSRSTEKSNKNSTRVSAEKPRVYIIEALLDLILNQPQTESVLRHTACAVVQAYLAGHDRIKAHFLQRAISGHLQHEDAANVLNALTQPSDDTSSLLLASWLVQDLIVDNVDAKVALAAVKEGDESEGEDVLTFSQSLGSQLEKLLLRSVNDASFAAYASLLIVLAWEFTNGIDDLLAECSSLVQAIATLPKSSPLNVVRNGLGAALLGSIYEFSTKDSPIPRRMLAPLLTEKFGRNKYLTALAELRRDPAVKDFDLQEGNEDERLFGSTFVELFSVEYSRLRKAIDKDPGIEVLPLSAAEAGVDRDVLDDLRQQIQGAKDALAQAQESATNANQKSEQDKMSLGKELQSARAEVERLQRINQSMQQGHESDLESLTAQHEQQRQKQAAEHQRILDSAKQSTNTQIQTAVREREAAFAESAREYERRLAELGNAHRSEQSEHTNTRKQLETVSTKHTELAAREKSLDEQLTDLRQRHIRLQKDHEQMQNTSSQSSSELERLQTEVEQRSSEAERLSNQLKELQDELQSRDEELAAERAGFADLEKELEAAKSDHAVSSSDADPALEQQVREAQESEKNAKEELENMLLVMGDIEAKRDAYRDKVKELGGEVTEDEDDEEGDDEEEEEGDDVD